MTEVIEASDLKYDARGLIPCVVQQYDTGEVLMVAWMNEESVGLTLKTGTTWFWSRSRQELWNKGATSGNMQEVKELWADCDSDTLLVKVDSPGPACHTGNRTCFFKKRPVGRSVKRKGLNYGCAHRKCSGWKYR